MGAPNAQDAIRVGYHDDPNSERILSDRAGDILHRIKDDDLYLDFRQLYAPDFPRLLWERYADELALDGLTFRIVDKPTLEALGQICERTDLSNGPRTVANAFRRIACYFADTGVTYTPMQLIDDFLSGAIIFDGDTSLIASIMTEFSSYAYFTHTDAHRTVLKLLAAFPRGCPSEVAQRYGVAETFEEVTTELRGEVVTLLPGGYSLIDLQRVGKPIDKLSLILKKYWMQIADAELDSEENCRRFAEHMVPLLFPRNSLRTETWSPEGPAILSVDGAYTQTYTGCLHDRHPQRRVRVCTYLDAGEPPRCLDDDQTIDLTLLFALSSGTSARRDTCLRVGDALVFCLSLGRLPERSLPPELRVVEHNLSPQPCTPAVLLNVIEFALREAAAMQLTQQEQTRINRALDHMRRWVLSSVLHESIFASVDLEAATPGYRGMRDLLFRECDRRFPHYRTLITTSAWRENLATYRQALTSVSLAQRSGIEPLIGTKAQLAVLFGQRSHAGLESKMRVQYPTLLEITGDGDRGTLHFLSHPMELQILAYVSEEYRSLAEITALGRAEGYTCEEIEEILSLLSLRGQIQEDNGRLRRASVITQAEVQRLGAACARELEAFMRVVPTVEVASALELTHAMTAAAGDDVASDQRAHSLLVSLMDRMVFVRASAYERLTALLDEQYQTVTELLRGLDVSIPVLTTQVAFKNYLEGARKHLEEGIQTARRIASRLLDAIQVERAKAATMAKEAVGAYLAESGNGIEQRKKTLGDVQERAGKELERVGKLRAWSRWADQFARLRLNMAALVFWLGDSDTSARQLASMLDDLEHDVRDQLAQVGLVFLARLDEVQVRFEAIAREYERSHMEREAAFEREKLALEAHVGEVTGLRTALRGKYQTSQHQESYRDLYAEAVQLAANTLHGCLLRIDAASTSVPRARRPAPGKSAGVGIKADRRMIRELREIEQFLAAAQIGEVAVRSTLRDDMLPRAAELLHRIRATLGKSLAQGNLWRDDEHLLTELTTKPQDLATIIDIQQALSTISPESDLARLLTLSLRGYVRLQVKRRERREDGARDGL